MEITKEVIQGMRDWVSYCTWLDSDEIETLTDDEIVEGVERHYSGGVKGFVADFV